MTQFATEPQIRTLDYQEPPLKSYESAHTETPEQIFDGYFPTEEPGQNESISSRTSRFCTSALNFLELVTESVGRSELAKRMGDAMEEVTGEQQSFNLFFGLNAAEIAGQRAGATEQENDLVLAAVYLITFLDEACEHPRSIVFKDGTSEQTKEFISEVLGEIMDPGTSPEDSVLKPPIDRLLEGMAGENHTTNYREYLATAKKSQGISLIVTAFALATGETSVLADMHDILDLMDEHSRMISDYAKLPKDIIQESPNVLIAYGEDILKLDLGQLNIQQQIEVLRTEYSREQIKPEIERIREELQSLSQMTRDSKALAFALHFMGMSDVLLRYAGKMFELYRFKS